MTRFVLRPTAIGAIVEPRFAAVGSVAGLEV